MLLSKATNINSNKDTGSYKARGKEQVDAPAADPGRHPGWEVRVIPRRIRKLDVAISISLRQPREERESDTQTTLWAFLHPHPVVITPDAAQEHDLSQPPPK
jgi:hypothetical protein